MAKQPSKSNKHKSQKVDYEPVKVGLAVAIVAAVSLVLVAMIAMY